MNSVTALSYVLITPARNEEAFVIFRDCTTKGSTVAHVWARISLIPPRQFRPNCGGKSGQPLHGNRRASLPGNERVAVPARCKQIP